MTEPINANTLVLTVTQMAKTKLPVTVIFNWYSQFVREGGANKLNMVKRVKRDTNWDLKESKDFYDEHIDAWFRQMYKAQQEFENQEW